MSPIRTGCTRPVKGFLPTVLPNRFGAGPAAMFEPVPGGTEPVPGGMEPVPGCSGGFEGVPTGAAPNPGFEVMVAFPCGAGFDPGCTVVAAEMGVVAGLVASFAG